MSKPATATIRCVIGFDYQPKGGKRRRFEPGGSVAGLPKGTTAQLLKDGVIEQTSRDADAADDAAEDNGSEDAS